MRLWHRPADRVIMAEVRKVYAAVPVGREDVVLDIGAHIGAASRFFAEQRAKRIIAVEPDPDNLRLLRKNAPRGALVLWAAVGPKLGRTTLHASGSHLSTTVAVPGRKAIEVPMVTLGGLLAQFRPSIVKIDAEFGEFAMPELRALPAFVKVLAMEIHVRLDVVHRGAVETEDQLRARREATRDLVACIEAQGFVERFRREKRSKDGPITDGTGLHPLAKSVDAVWVR